ncbi:MAG TPA: hypothetical protein VK020_09990 [Microlunatus sp.]|nr:hypothetical protein [Microlunatus sp.]
MTPTTDSSDLDAADPAAGGGSQPRRLAVVLADHGPQAPPGVDPDLFARACLADGYEVLADLAGVRAGIAGGPDDLVEDLLWPGAVRLPGGTAGELARRVAEEADELVLVAADAPDLPGLVLAKLFQGLRRCPVVVAPQRPGAVESPGWVALGVRLPWPDWLPGDVDPSWPVSRIRAAAPDRRSVRLGPDWRRLRTPESAAGLDPGLEGWEQTRALLEGRPLLG